MVQELLTGKTEVLTSCLVFVMTSIHGLLIFLCSAYALSHGIGAGGLISPRFCYQVGLLFCWKKGTKSFFFFFFFVLVPIFFFFFPIETEIPFFPLRNSYLDSVLRSGSVAKIM